MSVIPDPMTLRHTTNKFNQYISNCNEISNSLPRAKMSMTQTGGFGSKLRDSYDRGEYKLKHYDTFASRSF